MQDQNTFEENALIKTLRGLSGQFKLLFLAVLAALVVLNFFIGPYDPHVAWEVYPGFWAGFGLVLAVAMAFVMKRIVAPLIGAPEDVHD